MKTLKVNLYTLTTTALALFTVGCLVILCVFVPMWLQSEPAAFLHWFAANGKTIGMIMLPLEMAPLMLSLNSYIRSKRAGKAATKWLLLTNICNFIILGMFFIYFLPVNGAFMDSTIPLEEVRENLLNWQFYHIIRTVLAFVAVLFSVKALMALTQAKRNYVTV